MESRSVSEGGAVRVSCAWARPWCADATSAPTTRKVWRSDMLLNTAKGPKSMGIHNVRPAIRRPAIVLLRPSYCLYSSGVVDEDEGAAAADDGRQDLEHLRVEQGATLGREVVDGCLGRERSTVGADRRQSVECIGSAQDTAAERDGLTGKAARVAGAVPVLVMVVDVEDRLAQVA